MSRLAVVLTLVAVVALAMVGCKKETPATPESAPSQMEGPAPDAVKMIQEGATKAQEAATEVMEEVSETVEEAAAKVEEVKAEVEEKAGEVMETVTGAVEGSDTKAQELPGTTLEGAASALKKEMPTIP